MDKLDSFVYSNGLPALHLYAPLNKAITAIFIVGAGSRMETATNNGISRFYTNICWQGCKNYPSADMLWDITDQAGLAIKTIVQPEYTLFYFSAVPEVFNNCFDLMMQIIFSPNINEDTVNKERQISLAEINYATSSPEYNCLNTLNNLMFNNGPLGFNPLGSMQSLQSITPQALEAFKKQYYLSQNCLLTLISPQEKYNFNSLSQYINIVAKGKRPLLTPFDFTQTKIVRDKIQQPGQVSYISLANLCLGRHEPKKYAQNLLLQILAEGRKNSRFKILRDKKLVSLVRPWIKTLDDCAVFTIQAYTTAQQEKDALNGILEELGRASKNTITQDEVNRAKAFYNNQLAEKLASSLELGMFYALSYFFNLEEKSPEEILARVKQINLNQMNEIAQLICRPEAFSYITMGPGF